MLLNLSCAVALSSEGKGVVPAASNAVIYEANLRALGPHGGFVALANRLRAIKLLGVNVLWLMPIQPVGRERSAGGLGSPYALKNFDELSDEFGSSQDLTGLVRLAHRLNIAVILDWVADHTAWDNPWITEHPEWFLHDRQRRITIPSGTNWNDTAALDYRSRPMRKQMVASMQSWITRFNFDGFRCDSADRMPFDFWSDAIHSLRMNSGKPIFMLAEGERADDYRAGFDVTYGWRFSYRLREIFAGKPATDLAPAYTEQVRDVPPGKERLNFVTNHDWSAWEGSLGEMYKTIAGQKAAFAIVALYGGDPLIYTGQEVAYQMRISIFDDTTIDWSKNPDVFTWMKQIVDLRTRYPAFVSGARQDDSSNDVVMFSRSAGTDQALVLANVRAAAKSVSVNPALSGDWTDGISGETVHLSLAFLLGPYDCRILIRKSNVAYNPSRTYLRP